MNAVTVSNKKLKITLTAKESSELFEGKAQFSCIDKKTKLLLKVILKRALYSTNFTLDCDRLFVEIYPSARGGHIIYFTKAALFKKFRKNPRPNLCFVLKFKNSANLTEFCKTVNISGYRIPRSELHKYGGKYFLILRQNEKSIPFSLITEFTDSLLCSQTSAAIIGEYGKCILKNDAIEVISKL